MKRMLLAALLALGLLGMTQAEAWAWGKIQFSAGVNFSWERSGTNLCWGGGSWTANNAGPGFGYGPPAFGGAGYGGYDQGPPPGFGYGGYDPGYNGYPGGYGGGAPAAGPGGPAGGTPSSTPPATGTNPGAGGAPPMPPAAPGGAAPVGYLMPAGHNVPSYWYDR